ncbi:hypothetical protein CEXT_361881 [Caerostris extrusa]|uniref:Uncharacterized protein n=1 Tax=Caerostris extrusa TaxID=172846 RepID=A0AAV4TZ92_CAEEX|nr:hypothetical protein CEXT_361881 [Caerostris extrusa]
MVESRPVSIMAPITDLFLYIQSNYSGAKLNCQIFVQTFLTSTENTANLLDAWNTLSVEFNEKKILVGTAAIGRILAINYDRLIIKAVVGWGGTVSTETNTNLFQNIAEELGE